jgi:PAS domain S-box-containing protein
MLRRMTGDAEGPASSLADSPSSLLRHAVGEAARLLRADGAIVYLVEAGSLRFEVDAGIQNPEARQLIRDLVLPLGQGMFGAAVERREMVVTGDYLGDPEFRHSDVADRIATTAGMRSMAVAPLLAEGEVLGALGAYAARVEGFGEAELGLLRALADHAAAAIWNLRLIERLNHSQAELAQRVEAQRTLGQIAAGITAIHDPADVLQGVVDAAKRLIASDGAHLTLMAADGRSLRPTVIAGGMDEPTRAWLAQLDFPVEGGINGLAAARSELVWTADYEVDPRIPHEEEDREVASRLGVRAMAAAPLRAVEGGIMGTLAVSFASAREFGSDELELLQGLADQGAIAIANARLTERLSDQAHELGRRVEVQRTLADIAGAISSLREPAAVLQRAVDEAVRLLGADGGLIDQLDPETGVIDWGPGTGAVDEPRSAADAEAVLGMGEGIAGLAMQKRRVAWTGDYLEDDSFIHSEASDSYARRRGFRSVMSAPLVGGGDRLATLSVMSTTPDAFDADDADVLLTLASHAAIALTNAQLDEDLRRQAETQRTLAGIAAQLTSIRDADAVLRRAVDEATRLLGADAAMINPLDAAGTALDLPLAYAPADRPLDDVPVAMGQGVSGRSLAQRRVVWTADYLGDPQFEHTPELDAYIRRRGMASVMSAPLTGSSGAIGVLTVQARRRNAFDVDDAELLGLLADHAAIAISNARLYAQLRERADAQQSLAEIAGHIASLRDPTTVLQRAVADAARLLGGDRAQVNLMADGGEQLERPIAAAPDPPSDDDVVVPLGSGIAGRAAADRRVRWTGDYLADSAFPHDEGDLRIRQQGIHSMMSAPLIGPDRLIGAITVQSSRAGAFDEGDAELLKLLADQAAIAITNAELYEQLTASEERYRFLVDTSPDIVWSVDADGRFSFFSDSLEPRTGWKQEQMLGTHFSAFMNPDAVPMARAAWSAVQESPHAEQRLRIELPLADGRSAPVEITMVGTVLDGRFAGAHGSVRDITQRERLEADLRGQAAELAAGEERAHLARELHDSVTQALFSMGLTARSLEILLDKDPAAAREKLTELRDLQRDALAEMRALIFELRPSSLEQDGLVQAIRNHAAAVGARTGLAVTVEAEPIERLALDAEEALYRIAQESLHNVVKHAGARGAQIRLEHDARGVVLTVIDDGEGFDLEQVGGGHLGLVGMRQRAERVGAEIGIASRPGAGTSVTVRLSLPEAALASAE